MRPSKGCTASAIRPLVPSLGSEGRLVAGHPLRADSLEKDAGGSRTHLNRVAAGRLAVWLQRHRDLRDMPSPGIEPGLRPSQGRVRVRSHSEDVEPLESPARESNPALRLRRPPCARHTRGESALTCRIALIPRNALARSRTWSATFGGSRALPSHSKGSYTAVSNAKGLADFHRFHEFLGFAPFRHHFSRIW